MSGGSQDPFQGESRSKTSFAIIIEIIFIFFTVMTMPPMVQKQ